ncbi:hypothetical protein SO802_013967 [Lithocarpus litseifolius]|uniref:ABC transporter domain-containing protein n=1 Tax=Lithocarpus litseifolius TaxID=425828 RepID=A0AAW2DB79_9ROSI
MGVHDDIELSNMQSPGPSSVYSESSTKNDTMITLPITGTVTPMTPGTPTIGAKIPEISDGLSPIIQYKIENTSPKTARHVARRMYKSLKRHLQVEAGKAVEIESTGIEEIKEEEVDGVDKKSEELLGMEYMLRDGFVSYLPDMARITPPIPQQVVCFSDIEYRRKFEILNNGICVRNLEFAGDCTQGLRLENFTPQMRKFFAHTLVEGHNPFLEYVLEILCLKHIENKLTGEAISNADRQKLTTAELALGTYSVMIYDQPFSGCDLAATYDLVDTIRTISRIQQSSAIMSLTQLSQEVFDLFDRIILLTDGHVLFQGPHQDVIPYFAKLGCIKPSYVESSEFLEHIAAGDSSQYIVPGATPLTLEELAECYRASDHSILYLEQHP